MRDGVAAGGGDVHFIGVYRGSSRTGSRMRAWNRMKILVELREGTREWMLSWSSARVVSGLIGTEL